MEIKNKHKNNTDLDCIRIKIFSIEDNRQKLNPSNKTIETLLSQKFSIEILLKMVKMLQFDSISKKALLKDNKTKKEKIKEFKANLKALLGKKMKVFNQYQKDIEGKKEKIKNNIHTNNKKRNNDINYISEIEQLKFINFNIENEIQNIDCVIKEKNILKQNEINYTDNINKQKIYCENRKKDELTANKIMKDEKERVKKQLIDLTAKKTKQEEEIKDILKKISTLKNKIKEKSKESNIEKSKESSSNKIKEIKNKSEKCQNIKMNFERLIHDNEDCLLSNCNIGSESSNKETNFCSVKDYVLNIDKFNEVTNNNYDYLKKKIFLDIDRDKTLNSFNSSLDSNF